MAGNTETLGIDQTLPPSNLEFKRQHRWILEIDGLDAYTIHTFARPSFSQGEIKVDYINTIRYYTGKFEWQTAQMGLYDPITPSAAQKVMDWVQLAYVNETGQAGYKEIYASKSFNLKLLDPPGNVVELWKFVNPWPETVEFGALDWGNPEVAQIMVTVRFDLCTLRY